MYKIIILQTPGKNKKQTLLSIFLTQVSPLQSSLSIINQSMLHFKNNNYKQLLHKNILNRGEFTRNRYCNLSIQCENDSL